MRYVLGWQGGLLDGRPVPTAEFSVPDDAPDDVIGDHAFKAALQSAMQHVRSSAWLNTACKINDHGLVGVMWSGTREVGVYYAAPVVVT